MDDQLFQSLIRGPSADGADQQALINQLRSQKQMGDFYSQGSSEVAPQGQRMQTQALNSAKQIGDRRQQGLTRTRQAEQDAFAKEKHAQTLKGFTDIKQYNTPDGIQTWGISKSTGQPERITEMDKMTEFEDPRAGKDTYRYKMTTGEEAFVNTTDKTVYIPRTGKTYSSIEDAEEQISKQKIAEGAESKQRAVDWGSADVKEVRGRIDAIVELDNTMAQSDIAMDNMINAIDKGATSGAIYSLIPTFTDATAQLESAKSQETLAALGKHKLTPVSDRDLAELRKSAVPNLQAEALSEWANHKKESMERIRASNRIMETYLRNHKTVPTGEDRDKLRAQMDDALYGKDRNFSFAHRLNAEPAGSTGPLPEEVIVDDSVGWTVIEN